jgi:hypothetical protein
MVDHLLRRIRFSYNEDTIAVLTLGFGEYENPREILKSQ